MNLFKQLCTYFKTLVFAGAKKTPDVPTEVVPPVVEMTTDPTKEELAEIREVLEYLTERLDQMLEETEG